MTVRTVRNTSLSAAMGQLYGYIYCMLVSNMLVGMPLFGGALYLCGRAVMVSVSVFSRKNRPWLPIWSRTWAVLMMLTLLTIGVLLIGIYPAAFQSEKVWIMYATVALWLCSDGVSIRMTRLTETSRRLTGRALVLNILIQTVIIGATAVILIVTLGWNDGWPMAAGFAIMAFGNMIGFHRQNEPWTMPYQKEPNEDDRIRNVQAYHSMVWVSLLLVMAVELTTAVIYALLATNQDWLFPAIVVAVLCTVIPAMAGSWLLRRAERSGRKDPTWLLISGLIIWLTGIFLCSIMLRGGRLEYIRVYFYLSVCTIGGTMSLTGLRRVEEIMPDAVSVTGRGIPAGYWKMRSSNWELARLMGDMLALIAMSVFCFINGKDLPQSAEELATRFQPVMMIPVILVIIGALVSVMRFPLSGYYINKLKKFLQLQESGEENQALQRQLEHVVAEPYRQPFLSRFLMGILRPFYRHTLEDEDHIVQDDENPLVFLCNHGEIYGPIVCKLFIPVPVRAWTISMMMADKAEVTAYVYRNTFGPMTFLPVFVRKMLARIIGWLSVRVMDQLESIPVYRDSPMKLRETVRRSVEALEAGDNLLIFPETMGPKYESKGVGQISPGFVMLAEAYWKKEQKKMRMLPMYANREKKTLTFGTVITYNPERGFRDEQTRIIAEVETQIQQMAGQTPGGCMI